MLRYLLLISLIICTNQLHAQKSELREDFEIWLSASLNKKLNKKWDAQITIADRFENNARFQKTAFVEPSLSFQPVKRVETSLSFRYNYDLLDKQQSSRFLSRSSYTYRLKPVNISYRLRFDKYLDSRDLLDVIRHRIGVQYKRKKHNLSPGISWEYMLNNKSEGWEGDRWRLRAEIGYKLNKRHRVEIGYNIQREFNRSNPNQDYSLTFSYRYNLPSGKKKEKAI